jgi:hypothetical protein
MMERAMDMTGGKDCVTGGVDGTRSGNKPADSR